MTMQAMRRTFVLLALLIGTPTAALAQANCKNTANFDAWLAAFKKEALAKGISQNALAAASPYMVLEQRILNIDRSQKFFAQDFLEISTKMLPSGRLTGGAAKIKQYRDLFNREEKEFGVPASVITAFWGLESDFGVGQGKDQSIKSLTTLAYDCRRPDLFREQLLYALKVIDRGDLTAAEMRGPWAGELGQLQFIPGHYYDFGVDFDGDGKINLLKSSPDALASAANYLASLGWKRGQPWLEEVKVPQENFPWDQADLAIKLPRSKWASLGVKGVGGPLKSDALPASLVLPMGRFGPAFLAYPNFDAFLGWNSSLVYSTTAAYFATRLTGAPRVSQPSRPIDGLSVAEVKKLQTILAKRGYKIDKVDGVIGAQTRTAVKAVQTKLGLPADSYPTKGLLAKLT